jgi:hypothetical protein
MGYTCTCTCMYPDSNTCIIIGIFEKHILLWHTFLIADVNVVPKYGMLGMSHDIGSIILLSCAYTPLFEWPE